MRAAMTSVRPTSTRTREALVDDDLRGAQHALVLAFGVDDALRRRLAAANTGSIGVPDW